MNPLAVRDPRYHSTVVKLLADGEFLEATWQVAYHLPIECRDSYVIARDYVLHHYADLLRRFGLNLVEVKCTCCEEHDLRISPNLEPCRICGCSTLQVARSVDMDDILSAVLHTSAPAASAHDPWCHRRLLDLLAAKRFRDAVLTVDERLPVLDWASYQRGLEFLLRHYTRHLRRWGSRLVWTECASCGEHELRIKPRLGVCRICGGQELIVLARAYLDEPPRPGRWPRPPLPPRMPAQAQPAFSGLESCSPVVPELGFGTGWHDLWPRSSLGES